ncbi:MAG: TIGR03619 family F420-dependent LLM class oxidoreductase [Actinomycetota bacterium]
MQLPEVEREVRWPEYVAMALAGEEVGFDSVWVGDHYLYRDETGRERGPWEAWTTLAALAQATERVELGPLVACAGFHRPVVLAKLAASVDEISRGRLRFGIGAGWNRAEFDALGAPYDLRVTRFEEAFDVIRRLLAGEHVTSDGRFGSVSDAALLPAPARRLPLMIGSNSDRMLAAALPHVDAWNTWFDGYGNTATGFRSLNERISAACERAGRDPGTVRRSACVLIRLDPASAERPNDPPAIDGPIGAIADTLRGFADAGAGEVILVLDPITEASIRTLGEVLAVLDR